MYGEAFLLVNSKTGKQVVVKNVPLEGLDEDEVRYAVAEVDALNRLAHPNIVRCLGSWVAPAGGNTSLRPWEDEGNESSRLPLSEAVNAWAASETEDFDGMAPPSLNILTEFIDGGALDSLLQRNPERLDEELVGSWIAQVVLAIEHMHGRSLLHRDIKVRAPRWRAVVVD